MNSRIGGLLTMAFTMQPGMEANMEDWKERILKQWDESKKMPRKMKKRVRKELNLEWSIACWNPYDEYSIKY